MARAAFLTGEIFVTIGVILAGYVFYQLVWTDRESGRQQAQADAALSESWSAPPNTRAPAGHGQGQAQRPNSGTDPDSGTDSDSPRAFARLSIPEFGSDFRFAVMEGVSAADLEAGPGHYPSSAAPGEPGNFAVAGHRVGRGSPFNALGRLDTCAEIDIETADSVLEYRVLPTDAHNAPEAAASAAAACLPGPIAARLATDYAGLSGREIVTPDRVDVIAPNPTVPHVSPRDAPAPGALALLTLTTCHPQFSATERLIIHAALARSTPKANAADDGGRPDQPGGS
ncbi:class E sortase [Dietzia sp.]|uniref:class E sortase n=1 Tax=Dietzia sp. TaxID=1871616 RepID=UPI002FDB5A0E